MSTTFTPKLALSKPAFADRSWHLALNANADQVDAQLGNLAVKPAESPSASLNIAVASGVYQKQDESVASYAGTSSFAVTASTTNLLWLTEAGVLTKGTSWPTAGTYHVRLAAVVAGTSTVTSIVSYLHIPRSVSS